LLVSVKRSTFIEEVRTIVSPSRKNYLSNFKLYKSPAYLMSTCQDLTDIGGYRPIAPVPGVVRDPSRRSHDKQDEAEYARFIPAYGAGYMSFISTRRSQQIYMASYLVSI
jgi:hypothetical protein